MPGWTGTVRIIVAKIHSTWHFSWAARTEEIMVPQLKKRCELRTCVVPSANPIKPATPAGMKTTAMKTLTIKQKQPEMRGLDLIDKKDSSSGLPRRRRSLRPTPQCRFYKRNVVYKVQRAHLLWYDETKALRRPDLNLSQRPHLLFRWRRLAWRRRAHSSRRCGN